MENNKHCVKSVQIWSFSGSLLPVLGLNTEIYSVNLRVQSICGKIRTRKTPYLDNFYAVKKIRENAEKDVRTKEKVIRNVSENCKNAPFEKISENDKTNFKCNFENDLKFLRKTNMHKTVVRQININSIRNKSDPLMAAAARNIDILLITEIKFI